MTDSAELPIQNLRIFGKSTQDGVPTPEKPIPIISVGDNGNIALSVNEQKLTLFTPNGLPGIKVDSNGNYTDSNGQQWICDEIDLTRGKYVQRIAKGVFDGNLSNYGFFNSNNIWHFGKSCLNSVFGGNTIRNDVGEKGCALCDKFIAQADSYNTAIDLIYVSRDGTSITLRVEVFGQNVNADVVKEYFTQNPMTVYCLLKEPIEYSLSPPTINEFKKVSMNYPTTIISNDENAEMELTYTVDTKSYIDRKIAEISSAIVKGV